MMANAEREPTRVSIEASGAGAVAAGLIAGPVQTGDHARVVTVAPGVLRAPDEVDLPATGVSNLPRPPARVFVGRDEHLQRLIELLSEPTRSGRGVVGQAVQGLGGIGKSELALQYAATRRGPGLLVWWIIADTRDHLNLGLAALAYRLQPAASIAGWSTDEAADWASAWLQANSGWLLVLDNVDDPADTEPLLGQVDTGDILVTTRRNIDWHRLGLTPMHLDLLDRGASITLLRTILGNQSRGRPGGTSSSTEPADLDPRTVQGPETPDDDLFDLVRADDLAAELGDLPLALAQAGAYIAQQHIPIGKYLARLRANASGLLTKVAPGHPADRAVARTWDLTLTALSGEVPGAIHILHALAWLAPDNLPRHVLVPEPDEHDEDVSDSGSKDPHDTGDEIDEVLAVLASYSLITLTATHVSIHRLLQSTLRADATRNPPGAGHGDDENADEEARATPFVAGQDIALLWLLQAVPKTDPAEDIESWIRWRVLVPHIERLLSFLPDTAQMVDNNVDYLLSQTAFYLIEQGRYADAVALNRREAAMVGAAYAPDHPQLLLPISNLANALLQLGDPAAARPLFERALAIGETAYGPDHPQLLSPISNLGQALFQLGDPAAARPLFERALATGETAYGPDHPQLLSSINNLANALLQLGDPAGARPLLERALAIGQTAYGPDHPQLLFPINNLGQAIYQQGDPAAARPLFERALAIGRTAYGPDHPQLLLPINNLGNALLRLGDPAGARPLFERSLAIGETAYGPDHPQLLSPISNLASALLQLGDPTAARTLFERALVIGETAYGPDHPNVAVRLYQLGRGIRDLDTTAATAALERALAIDEAAYGSSHAKVLNDLAASADVRQRAGDHEAAVRQYQRLLDIYERTYGPDSYRLTSPLRELAGAQAAADEHAAALTTRQRLVHLHDQYGSEKLDVVTDLRDYACSLEILGEHDESNAARALAVDIEQRRGYR